MQIDKNIPIVRRKFIPQEVVDAFMSMTVGDSSLITEYTIDALRARLKRVGVNVSAKREGSGYRVWRV